MSRLGHRDALRVRQTDLLGHELAEDDREDRQQPRDDDQGEGLRPTCC